MSQDKNEAVFLEGQMGQLKVENAQDMYTVRQMEVQEQKLSQAMGTDNDFFEVIPGYLASVS